MFNMHSNLSDIKWILNIIFLKFSAKEDLDEVFEHGIEHKKKNCLVYVQNLVAFVPVTAVCN
jgi:hypothetical protein